MKPIEQLRNSEVTQKVDVRLLLIPFNDLDASFSGVVSEIDADFEIGMEKIVEKIYESNLIDSMIEEIEEILDYYKALNQQRADFICQTMRHFKLQKVKLIHNGRDRLDAAIVYEVNVKPDNTILISEEPLLEHFTAIKLNHNQSFIRKIE
jgi:hypothetical protein